jgi:hypothetical protein
MSLLGKILVFANVLAALLFFFLGLQVYGKRQAWSFAVRQHELAIRGLPLDDQEKDREGRPRVDQLSKQMLQDLFARGSGQPVRTQLEEVTRVRTDLMGQINGKDPEQKKQLCAQVLLALTTTGAQRLAIEDNLVDPKQDTAEWLTKIDHAFDEALKEDAGAPTPHRRSLEERKQAVAHLLFSLGEVMTPELADPNKSALDTPAFKRAVVVVGLENSVQALESQFVNLQKMYSDEDRIAQGERNGFLARQHQLVSMVQDLAVEAKRQEANYKVQDTLSRDQKQVVLDQEAQRDKVKKEIAATIKTAQGKLQEQAKLEQDLFEALVQLRDAGITNQRLEERLLESPKDKNR